MRFRARLYVFDGPGAADVAAGAADLERVVGATDVLEAIADLGCARGMSDAT